ncbi:MAG: response regulator [Candidatus Aminicenantes bacterium]|nr:MAG: response regulator [Candidatus Aminicenantes bacterium]
MENKTKPFIQVYCPECQEMISPGEWTACPYFEGEKLDIADTEDAMKQIFRCHVQCDCKIEYSYYEGDQLVTKVEEAIEDPESLRRILSLVTKKDSKQVEGTPKKVLLVDDDRDFLEMHTAVLEHRGYAVVTARSSKECMAVLDEAKPDIVILDVMMEQFDSGFKASEKIKQKHKDLPVMLLTSISAQTNLDFSSSDDVLKISGADVLLDKPVSPKVLIDEIERLTS